MNKNNIIIIVIAVLVSLGAGFFGGMQYQKSQRIAQFNRTGLSGSDNGRQNGNGNPMFNRPVTGDITSVGDKTLTVKLPDGSSKIVIYADSTKINKTTEGEIKDLKSGVQVSIIGTTGSDNTVTAQNIFIGDNFFGARILRPTSTP